MAETTTPEPAAPAASPLRVDPVGAMGADRVASSPAVMASSPSASDPANSATASAPALMAVSPPAMSRSGLGGSGRGIRQKVVDELKSVRKKVGVPSPLQLSISTSSIGDDSQGQLKPLDEEGSSSSSSQLVQQLSPAGEGAATTGKAKGCSICERAFTVFRAKHTCKICANKICDDCSRNRMKLNRRLERKKGSRLCDPCARNYLQTPTGTPMMSPAPSPLLSPRQRENGGLGVFQLPRRHSVPAKTLSEFLHGKKNGESAPAATQKDEEPAASSANAATAATKTTAKQRSGVSRRKIREGIARTQSHLRRRHWISLGALALLLLLRVFLTRSIDGSTLSNLTAVDVDVDGRPVQSMVLRGVDSLLSLRILGSYVLGLIMFDEFRRSRRKNHAVSHRSAAIGPPLVARRTSSTGSIRDSSLSMQGRRLSSPSPRPSQEDDELEVDTGDLGDEQKEDDRILDKLVAVLDEGTRVRAPDGDLQLSNYLETCELICTFIQVFGRATSFAGSTVSAYLTSIDSNLASWPSPPAPATSWKDVSVKVIIEREVELKIADVGGKKKPSCSRCLLRLLWFLEFVEACIKHGLVESFDENCAPGAGKAYEETIGKRHPWLIRKGVMSALGAIPTRSSILASLNVKDGRSEEGLAPLRHAQHRLLAVADELNAVFTAHDLHDLK